MATSISKFHQTPLQLAYSLIYLSMDLASLNAISKFSIFVQCDINFVHFSAVNRLSIKSIKENKQKVRSIGDCAFIYSIIETIMKSNIIYYGRSIKV